MSREPTAGATVPLADVAIGPEHPPDRPVVVVLGDLCVDLMAAGRLDGRIGGPGAHDGDLTFRTSLQERPGGTAYQFARAAAARRLRPVVLGAVGDDYGGRLLRDVLAADGIDRIVFVSTDRPTARVVIAYDEVGRRLMLTERDSANRHLPDVAPVLHLLPRRIDVLWVSGLSICDTSTPTFAAVVAVLAEARRRGAKVLLDVVPHRFYECFPSVDALFGQLGGVDGIVSEQRSMRILLGIGRPGERTRPATLRETARLALEKVAMVVLTEAVEGRYLLLAQSRGHGIHGEWDYPMPGDDRMAGLGDRAVCDILPGLLAVDAWDDRPVGP